MNSLLMEQLQGLVNSAVQSGVARSQIQEVVNNTLSQVEVKTVTGYIVRAINEEFHLRYFFLRDGVASPSGIEIKCPKSYFLRNRIDLVSTSHLDKSRKRVSITYRDYGSYIYITEVNDIPNLE